ncbi:MAG: hypothetical protein R6U98_23740, partial [Pirellulaceae bacterium]
MFLPLSSTGPTDSIVLLRTLLPSTTFAVVWLVSFESTKGFFLPTRMRRTFSGSVPPFLDHLDGLDAVRVLQDTAVLDLLGDGGSVEGALLERG